MPKHRAIDPHLRGFARSMRKAMTEAELRLWTELRDQKLDGIKFRRQVPIGPFIADFVAPRHRLIIELDGAHHYEDGAIAADLRRSSWLEGEGYNVLRFTNLDVLTNLDGVCRAITEAVHAVPSSP